MLLAGCVLVPEPKLPPEVARKQALPQHQLDGIQHEGREFSYRGYRDSDVVVTPSKNWYYGGADWRSGPGSVMRGTEEEIVAAATAMVGGMANASDARRTGTQRTQLEQRAIERLTLIGMYARAENLGPYYKPKPVRKIMGATSQFDVNAVQQALQSLDPDFVPVIDKQTVDLNTPIPEVRFETGKANLTAGTLDELSLFGGLFRGKSNLIIVGGFTDDQGNMGINRPLSIERAKVTAQAIRAGGAPDDALLLYGKPQCCYRSGNSTEAGRAENRRSEIRIGGFYTKAPALSPSEVGMAIAIIMKSVDGDANAPIRVYGAADSESAAQSIAQQTATMLRKSSVGMRNVVVGELAYSQTPELVFEVTGNFGVINE